MAKIPVWENTETLKSGGMPNFSPLKQAVNQAGKTISSLGNELVQHGMQMHDDEQRSKVAEAEAEFSRWSQEEYRKAEETRQGKGALANEEDGTPSVYQDYNTRAEEKMAELQSKYGLGGKYLDMARQRLGGKADRYRDTFAAFEGVQRQKYRGEVDAENLRLAENEAAAIATSGGGYDGIMESVEDNNQNIDTVWGGTGAEQKIANLKVKQREKIFASSIDAAMAQDPRMAKQILDDPRTSEVFSERVLAAYKAKADKAAMDYAVSDAAAAITENASEYGDALEMASAYEDPQFKGDPDFGKALKRAVKQEMAIKKEIQKEQYDKDFQEWFDDFHQNPTPDKIAKASAWMDAKDTKWAEGYLDNRIAKKNTVRDDVRYYELINLAVDDPEAFKQVNMTKEIENLAGSWDYMVKLQANMKAGGKVGKSPKEVTASISQARSMATPYYGKLKGAKLKDARVKVESVLADKVTDFVEANDRKPQPSELNQMVSDTFYEVDFTEPRSIMGMNYEWSVKKPTYEIEPHEIKYLEFDDIPPGELAGLRVEFRQRNIPFTKERALLEYQKLLALSLKTTEEQ